MKAQVVADVLITVSMVILIIGVVTQTTRTTQDNEKSVVLSYKQDLDKAISQSNEIKNLLEQERNYAFNLAQYRAGIKGGYPTSFKNIKCGIKIIEQNEIPIKVVPYLKTEDSSDCFPKWVDTRDDFIDYVSNYFKDTYYFQDYAVENKLINEPYFDKSYSFNFVEKGDKIFLNWFSDNQNIDINIERSIKGEAKNTVFLTIPNTISFTKDFDLRKLFTASENVLKNSEIDNFIQNFLEEKSETNVLIKIGENCVKTSEGVFCDNTLSGDLKLTNEDMSINQDISYKGVYCSFLKEDIGCFDNSCSLGGLNSEGGCVSACLNPSIFKKHLSCETPKTYCDKNCNDKSNLGDFEKFICSCDEYTINSIGNKICSSADWYPVGLKRTEDAILVEENEYEIFFGIKDKRSISFKEQNSWDKITANSLCVGSEVFKTDECCQKKLSAPIKECNARIWNDNIEDIFSGVIPDVLKTSCEVSCDYEDNDGVCFQKTIENKLKTEYETNLLKFDYTYSSKNYEIILADLAKSEIKITDKKTNNVILYRDCEGCLDSTVSSVKKLDSNTYINAFSACDKDNDDCECFTNSIVAPQTVEEDLSPEEYNTFCAVRYLYEKSDSFYKSKGVDLSEKFNTQKIIVSEGIVPSLIKKDGVSCVTNQDCDFNLENNGLNGICSNNKCVTCVNYEFYQTRNNLNNDCDYGSGSCDIWVKDNKGVNYFCNINKGFLKEFKDSGTCSSNSYCDLDLGENGLKSICDKESGECNSCSKGFDLSKDIETNNGVNYFCSDKGGVFSWSKISEFGEFCLSNYECNPKYDSKDNNNVFCDFSVKKCARKT